MTLLTQLRNGGLALLARLAYLFRQSASRSPERILVIQNAKLGDMVCTTPLFRAIKEAYPGSTLVVMGNRLNKELLSGHPHVDEYVVRPESLLGMIRAISQLRPDFACSPGPDTDALLVLLFARVPCVVMPSIENGYSPYETRAYRLARRSVFAVPHRMGSYAPREYLRLLEPLGIHAEDTRKELAVSLSAVENVKKILEQEGLAGEKLIGIAPGVGNKVKIWGGQRFAEVASLLAERYGARIVIIGGTEDGEEAEIMRAALPTSLRAIDLVAKLSLEELKALIKRLDLFISVDTGPIYIAEAFGVPTVDIVGPMDENEQPPRGGMHRVVMPERERAVLHIMNAADFDWAEARRQAEAVTPKMVLQEAEALLSSKLS